ncbi:MAG TPA: fibronectin type III domain-containing protein [Candidatus Saccharimonadales bacterium]|nr:fibronectin type III domain-containing protein [Candidatus Saccharimonadales bacterium]
MTLLVTLLLFALGLAPLAQVLASTSTVDYTRQLITSGNEITDASRTTNTQGDGLSNDSSYGIWAAATNLVANGGFETNTTGWIPRTGTSTTIARNTTEHKFGAASVAVTTPGSADYESVANGTSSSGYYTVSSSTAYTVSAWTKAAVGENTYVVWDELNSSGTYITSQFSSAVVGNGGWQRVTLTATTNGSTARLLIYVGHNTTHVASTFYVDGVQVETGSVATPYIETNGATASRSAGRVQPVSNIFSATQGWAAFRIRSGWGTAPSNATLFSWADSGNERIELVYVTNQWVAIKRTLGAGSNAASAIITPAVGDFETVIISWTSSTVKVSVNGAAFVSASNSSIPTLTATLADIGQSTQAANRLLDADVFWSAAGSGTLSDADASTINGFGNTDPTINSFSTTDHPTFTWSADTANYTARDYNVTTVDPDGPPTAPGCNDQAPTSAPTIFTAQSDVSSATLNFAPATPSSYYYIAYGTNSDNFQYGVKYNTDYNKGQLSYTVTGLTQHTSYYFKIRAGNGCATGPWGGWREVLTSKSASSGADAGSYLQGSQPSPEPSPSPQSGLVPKVTQILESPVAIATKTGGSILGWFGKIGSAIGSGIGTFGHDIGSLAGDTGRLVANGLTKTVTIPANAVASVFIKAKDTVVGTYYLATVHDQPKITNVQVSKNSQTDVVISWQTDQPTTSKVNYGFDTSYGKDVQNGSYAKDHKLILKGLDANKTYYFEVMGQLGNKYVYDAYYSFTTQEEGK